MLIWPKTFTKKYLRNNNTMNKYLLIVFLRHYKIVINWFFHCFCVSCNSLSFLFSLLSLTCIGPCLQVTLNKLLILLFTPIPVSLETKLTPINFPLNCRFPSERHAIYGQFFFLPNMFLCVFLKFV